MKNDSLDCLNLVNYDTTNPRSHWTTAKRAQKKIPQAA